MTATQTICLTVAGCVVADRLTWLFCWKRLMSVVDKAVDKHKGTIVKKTVEVDVK